jgi:hypothetical protein
MYNLNYAPTTLRVQSWREIISAGTQTKKVEYHCSRVFQIELYHMGEIVTVDWTHDHRTDITSYFVTNPEDHNPKCSPLWNLQISYNKQWSVIADIIK